jgi:hypothetical protein
MRFNLKLFEDDFRFLPDALQALGNCLFCFFLRCHFSLIDFPDYFSA